MASRALKKRLQALEETVEILENKTIFIYDPKVDVPEDLRSSYVVFLPDNGRDVIR